jgi:hypothetical protein
MGAGEIAREAGFCGLSMGTGAERTAQRFF